MEVWSEPTIAVKISIRGTAPHEFELRRSDKTTMVQEALEGGEMGRGV